MKKVDKEKLANAMANAIETIIQFGEEYDNNKEQCECDCHDKCECANEVEDDKLKGDFSLLSSLAKGLHYLCMCHEYGNVRRCPADFLEEVICPFGGTRCVDVTALDWYAFMRLHYAEKKSIVLK